jgi:hypothetical protein
MEKRSHVPFRNSTLTFLLSDSLSGDSKTLMFVNLSPVASNADESFCSLNFASRVRNVELGKASKHVVGSAVPAVEDGGAEEEEGGGAARAGGVASRSSAAVSSGRRPAGSPAPGR